MSYEVVNKKSCLFLIPAIVVYLGCINQTQERTVQFSNSVTPKSSGFINPESGSLFPGDSVALFAYPNLGYTFSHWNSDTTDTLTPKSFVISGDSSITGQFALDNFPKSYGGTFRETPTKFIKKDNTLFMIGPTRSNDGVFAGLNKGLLDFFIARYDADGSFRVLNNYGGSILDGATDFYMNTNNELVVTGWSRSDDGDFPSSRYNRSDIFVARIDQQGTILWKTTLGGSEVDEPTQVKAYDNGYLISGIHNSKDGFLGVTDTSTAAVAFILKMSAQGEVEWAEIFDGSNNEIVDHIHVLGDGSIVATGRTLSKDGFFEHSGIHPVRAFTFKLNPNRELEWITYHRDSERTNIRDTHLLNDREILLVGDVFDPAISDEIYAVKLNLFTGEVIWEHTYGGSSSDGAFAIDVDQDGDLYVAGPSASQDGIFSEAKDVFQNNPEAYIIQLDASGVYKSTFLLRGNNTDFMIDIEIDAPLIFYYGHTGSNSGDFDYRGDAGSNNTDIFLGAVPLSEFDN